MKPKILFIFSGFICFSFGSNPNPPQFRVKTSATFEKLIVMVPAGQDYADKFDLSVLDEKGNVVKTEKIHFTNDTEKSISIQELEFGKYGYIISNENKPIAKGEFVKDCYDSY